RARSSTQRSHCPIGGRITPRHSKKTHYPYLPCSSRRPRRFPKECATMAPSQDPSAATPTCPACDSYAVRASYLGKARWKAFSYDCARCAGCATLSACPPPPQELLSQLYAPEYLSTHYQPELEGESSRAELTQEMHVALSRLEAVLPQRGRLLDVGCGAG